VALPVARPPALQAGPGVAAETVHEAFGLLPAQIVKVRITGYGLQVIAALVFVDLADPGPEGVTCFRFSGFALSLGPFGVGSLLVFGQFLLAKGGGGAVGAETFAQKAFRDGFSENRQVIADVGSPDDDASLAAGEVQQFFLAGGFSGGLDGVLMAGFDNACEEGMIGLCAQGVLDAPD
jgi:hypothetical protein